MKLKSLIVFILFAGVILTGCASKPEVNTVKVAVLPVLDALPLHVALEQGYFADQGLEVELIPVSSAPERDALMQSGQVDAILNEIVSTLFYNQNENRVLIVRFLRVATPEYPLFRILASKESGITTAADLKNVPIGISEGTVIHYTTDRILENAGLAPDEISTVAIPKIPDRIALLASGELAAANLPDPAASASLAQGAVLVIDDTTIPEISSSVLSFDAGLASSSPETLRLFLKAVEQAVEDINADKESWLGLMVELGLLPPPLAGSYAIPDFPPASVPGPDQFNDALSWAVERGLIEKELEYRDSVSAEFLP